jgi:sugar (pentulose or hexulose) kinase
MAAESSIGARELLFVPHFAGSKSPYWNPKARACLHGLTLGHTRADIARALLEGIFLEVKKNIDLLMTQEQPNMEVRVSGGVTRSDFFNQLQADIYGLPVRRTSEEATSLGAAILGAHRIGWYGSLPEAFDEMGARTEMGAKHPIPAAHRLYREVLKRHHELYLALERAGF